MVMDERSWRDAAIRIKSVKKRFRLYHEKHDTLKETILARKRSSYTELWALDDVTYEFEKGRTYGIIGENGSGKSTLLKIITKILRPDSGTVTVDGRISALLELGAGFHPELTGRENIYLNGAILRLSRAEIDEKYEDIVDFSEISDFIDTPVKNYSSGMYMRLGFAIAVNVEPDILLIDEVLAVGDESFQKKCMAKLESIKAAGTTIVFVSHDAESVRRLCDQAILMDGGRITASGDTDTVIDKYHAMLSSREASAGKIKLRTAAGIPSKRFGTGEITMAKVEMANDQGKPAEEFASDDVISVIIEHDINEIVADPIFGLILFDKNGVQVYATNSRWRGMHLRELKPGERVTVEYRLRARLLPGSYSLTAAAATADAARFYDWWEDCAVFSMTGGTGSTGVADLQGELLIAPRSAILNTSKND